MAAFGAAGEQRREEMMEAYRTYYDGLWHVVEERDGKTETLLVTKSEQIAMQFSVGIRFLDRLDRIANAIEGLKAPRSSRLLR
jgi:hypothetical protein